jgi:hypothetical protein
MRIRQRQLFSAMVLLIVTLGQSLPLYSAPCAMGMSAGSELKMPADAAMYSMDHSNHSMMDQTSQSSDKGCCGDSAICLMALCSLAVGVLNTAFIVEDIMLVAYLDETDLSNPERTTPTLFRPPIFL